MINYLIKLATKKIIPSANEGIYAEDLIYNETIYPIYLQTRNNFNKLMHQGKMKRIQLLEFKKMVNEATRNDRKYYKNYKFENDAHEIYTKLQNKYITKHNMTKLNNYLIKLENQN